MTNTGVQFFSGKNIPLEMHKVKMVQKINLLPVEERLKAIQEAGGNSFLLKNRDVFLDMLTDSGTNAMSDKQYGAMMVADDSYAGSETFYKLEKTLTRIFGTQFFLPTHQGRACENILAHAFVKPGSTAITNYHFTTTMAHVTRLGGKMIELIKKEGLETTSTDKFKGDYDLDLLEETIDSIGPDNISFVRIEAGTNLIGGQPVSLENMEAVSNLCRSKGVLLVFDASLLADNLFFIKTRDEKFKDWSIEEISRKIASLMDITYFSARKLGCARGGGICTSSPELFEAMRELIPLFEGFLTYGGMSVREMEALNVGLDETMDLDVISQTPIFVEALGNELLKANIPLVTPFGGLGCHIDAKKFLPHIAQENYPAAALVTAIFIVSGIRSMERGTMSEQRNEDGSEHLASMELVRLAVPKRVFTLSHILFAADRISWLFENRDLIGGMEFTDEPKTLRFFLGKLAPIGDWQEKLLAKFLEDMPSGL
ncbi:MAG: tryptophanase [Tissierellia bacterium]|nr:tryptophanase [Tissierellia bacterium]